MPYVGHVEDDVDKIEWQARQAQLDAAKKKQREKDRKSRERSARKAQRKLERLKTQLDACDDLSDWEKTFSESVSERLDKYGSAFNDLTKGRAGEALSFSQKRVMSDMRKKLKAQKRDAAEALSGSGGFKETKSSGFKKKGFRRKNQPGYKTRIRHIEDDMVPPTPDETPEEAQKQPRKQIKPFLRLVKDDKR